MRRVWAVPRRARAWHQPSTFGSVRRVALVALVFLVFAPVARAGCGLTASPVIGAAPLAVTFAAPCESAAYAWDFGDGHQEAGRTVTHIFAAGYWARP